MKKVSFMANRLVVIFLLAISVSLSAFAQRKGPVQLRIEALITVPSDEVEDSVRKISATIYNLNEPEKRMMVTLLLRTTKSISPPAYYTAAFENWGSSQTHPSLLDSIYNFAVESGRKDLEGRCYEFKSSDFTQKGMHDSAMVYVLKAKKIFEESDNGTGLLNVHHILGDLFYHGGLFTKATEYYNEILKSPAIKTGNNTWRQVVLRNNLGLIAKNKGDFQGAERIFYENLELRRRRLITGYDSVSMSYIFRKLTEINIIKGDYKRAAVLLDSSAGYLPRANRSTGELISYMMLNSEINLQRGNTGELDEDIPKIDSLMKLLEQPGFLRESFLKLKAKYLTAIGDHAGANKLLTESIRIADSLKARQIYRGHLQYLVNAEFDQLEIEFQKNKLNLQLLIGGIVLLSAFMSVLSFMYIRISRNKKELEAKNKIIEKQRTDLEDSNEKLSKLNEMRSRFISTVSHEFKTPLTGLLSSLQLFSYYDQKLSDDQKKNLINRSEATIRHLNTLVEDVLLINHFESDDIIFTPEELNIKELVTSVIDLIRQDEKGIDISCECNLDRETYFFDKRLLSQILQNAIGNAVKYSPPESGVTITLSDQDDFLNIIVKDQGRGIPSEEMEMLFTRFYRGSNAYDTQGTGLGLAIMKRAAEKQGGTVQIESEVGKGTTVTIVLPVKNIAEQV